MDYIIKKIIYDGLKWYIHKGYYRNRNGRKIRYLHRYIWEQYNGKIPDGYIIHHIDFNTLNNDISNLQTMSIGKHSVTHNTGNKYSLGIKLSEERKIKIGNSSRGHTLSECVKRTIGLKNSMSVIQLDKDENIIKKHLSMSDASRELNISQSHISGCCNKEYGRKTAGGFKWRFCETN